MRGLRTGLGLTKRAESPAQIVARLLAEATIPTRDGTLTSTSTATVDPDTGATVPVNTANGRNVQVGGVTLPGAALLTQGASTGLMGAATISNGLLSNTAAPGDYPTVRTLVEDTSNGGHQADIASQALAVSTNYTFYALIRRGAGSRDIQLVVTDGVSNRFAATFNLTTFAITNSVVGAAVVVRSSIRAAGDFYLIQVTGTSTAWTGACIARFNFSSAGATSYTGDGVSSLIISGYDVIQADFARTPLAWDGSLGVSRVANLLSWNQALDTTAGTIIARVMTWGRSGTLGSTNPRIAVGLTTSFFWYNTASQSWAAQRSDSIGVVNATSASTPAVAGSQQAVTERWDASNIRITVNGVTVASAAPTIPYLASTPLSIGNDSVGVQPFEGHVFIAKWNRALTDAEVNLWIANTTILVP